MRDDQQLLRSYAREGSEAAFGELVKRHVNLVYSAALRRTGGDAHLAQDVAQTVFTDLARKAASLSSSVVLAGWLHRATRFAALQSLRTERRRRAREQEAVSMNAIESGHAPDWEQIRPLLDEALDGLGREDRDALLLRFFEQRSLAQVGEALGTNEDAARKRVSRALEKVRAFLNRRGATTTAVTLAAAISANAVQAAPAGLALSLTGSAIAGATMGAGATFAILNYMGMGKITAIAAGALIAGGLMTILVVQQQSITKLRTDNATLDGQLQATQQVKEENRAPKTLPVDAAELERMRGEHAELLRLRGEVTQLRGQLAAAQAAARPEPKIEDFVLVKGEVRNPGSFRWTNGMRLSNAILAAGGLTERADLAQVAVLPGTNRLQLTMYDTTKAGSNANPLLQPRDAVSIRSTGSTNLLASKLQFPRESWHFTGYATPEATIQSYVWALSQGQADAVLACLDPASELGKKLGDHLRANPSELTTAVANAENIRDFKILSLQNTSSEEVLLESTLNERGQDGPPQKIRLRKISGEWKMTGMDALDPSRH